MAATGRGGAGNFRSPSKDARAAAETAVRIEDQYIKEQAATQGAQIVRATPLPLLPCATLHSGLHVLD